MTHYDITHISDIMHVPQEHWDELFQNLQLHFVDASERIGEDEDPKDMIPTIRFWPDGTNSVEVL